MMKSLKKALSLLLALALTVSLSACSQSSGSGSSGSTAASTAASSGPSAAAGTQASAEKPTAAAEQKANKKDTLVIAAPQIPKAMIPFNPEQFIGQDDALLPVNIFETPFRLNPDGTISPWIATEYSWSDDGKDLTLTIRDDVHFSNGDPMTVDDVVWSIDTTANSRYGRQNFTCFDSIEKVDDTHCVIHMTDYYPAILKILAQRMASIMSQKYYEEVGLEGYLEKPLGTGPYLMGDWDPKDHLVFEINENYWNKEHMPFYKQITLKQLNDANTQMLALENGEIDVLLYAPISPLLKLPENSGISYSIAPAGTVLKMFFNANSGGIASDVRFRQAIAHAVNRDEINIGVYEGQANIAEAGVGSFFGGFPDAGTYTRPLEFDPEKAKELLKELNYNGEEFVITVQSGKKDELSAQIIQGQLMNIGINCTIKALDSASYSALTKLETGWDARVHSNTYSAIDLGQMTSFTYRYHQESSPNTYYASPINEEYEKLVWDSLKVSTEEERKEIFAKAISIQNEQVIEFGMIEDFSVCAYHDYVEGVVSCPMQAVFYLNDWH